MAVASVGAMCGGLHASETHVGFIGPCHAGECGNKRIDMLASEAFIIETFKVGREDILTMINFESFWIHHPFQLSLKYRYRQASIFQIHLWQAISGCTRLNLHLTSHLSSSFSGFPIPSVLKVDTFLFRDKRLKNFLLTPFYSMTND